MTTTTRMTLERFLAMPETKPYREFEDGEVRRKPMPTAWHGEIQRLLSFVFTLYLRAHAIGNAGSEIRCIFGPPGRERAYVPDYVVVVSPLGLHVFNSGPYHGAPDLAIEILSPDDRKSRMSRKVRFYLQNGVRLCWVIDPVKRTVEVMTSVSQVQPLTDDAILDGGDVLPGFRVPVCDILPPPVS